MQEWLLNKVPEKDGGHHRRNRGDDIAKRHRGLEQAKRDDGLRYRKMRAIHAVRKVTEAGCIELWPRGCLLYTSDAADD